MTARKKDDKKRSLTSTGKKQKPSKITNIADTYEVWLESQVKRRKTSVPETKSTETRKMPVDVMDAWLQKQPVVEKEAVKEVVLSPGTTEEWLRKQVSIRLSIESKGFDETVATSESLPSANVS